MSGELEVVFMRLLDRGAQLFAGESVVRLERGDALSYPEVDHLARFLRAFDLMELRDECVFTFEVGTGDPHLGTDPFAGVDPLFQFEVGIGLDAAGSTDRSDAAGKIETREAVRHLVINKSARRIEKMVVHSDQARNSGASGGIDDLGSLRRRRGQARTYRCDLRAGDNDGLIIARGSAGAVKHTDVGER